MAYPGAPKDGKSDVDLPFKPERKGQAKEAFDKGGNAPEKAATAQRTSSSQGRVPESIKRNAPGMDFDMPGGGAVKAQQARAGLSAEAAALQRQNAMQKTASKKLGKSNGLGQNKSKSQDKGRE